MLCSVQRPCVRRLPHVASNLAAIQPVAHAVLLPICLAAAACSTPSCPLCMLDSVLHPLHA